MYNFSTPAILKAYIDQIVRVNVTFSPSYEGLLKNKKAVVIVASAGVYTPGSHTESYNAETGYLKQILGFIGITDVTFVLAGGTADIDRGNIQREDLLAKYIPAVNNLLLGNQTGLELRQAPARFAVSAHPASEDRG
jgi:FMN-dependent NADH-azoreductase